MNVLIIPGFIGYPEETTFKDLSKRLILKGHSVTKIAWPNLPDNLGEYNFSHTLRYAREIIEKTGADKLAILGFSMGGIIATVLAKEFSAEKLGLIVSPYQAGNKDDLAGKYKNWQETGQREVTSSKFGVLKIPFSFIEDAQKYNALKVIPRISCPKLFIAGEKDTKVSLSVTQKLFRAAGQPKKWVQIPEMEHKYQYQPEILKKVNGIIGEFID